MTELEPPEPTDLEFIALARNAFDVMLRRKWNPIAGVGKGQWRVQDFDGGIHSPGSGTWPDPFTALVEADKWYRANVEEGQ